MHLSELHKIVGQLIRRVEGLERQERAAREGGAARIKALKDLQDRVTALEEANDPPTETEPADEPDDKPKKAVKKR